MVTKRRPLLWNPDTNAPESMDFSTPENAQLEAMRGAWSVLRKTFEQWTVIGRGLQTLAAHAERMGGRKTFQRLRDQQGIGQLDKGIVSRLLKIMDNLPQVIEWHSALPEAQQVEWASPNAVYKHCPLFNKAKPPPQPASVGRSPNLARVMEQQEARIEELEETIKNREDRIAELEEELHDEAPAASLKLSLDEARDLYLKALQRHCKSQRQVADATNQLVRKAKTVLKKLPRTDGSEEEKAVDDMERKLNQGLSGMFK